MFHVLAEVDEVRRADFQRFALQGGLAEERLGRGAGRLVPGLAKIRGPAEAGDRAEPWPVVGNIIADFPPRGMQAIGAVIPYAVIDQAAAGIAAFVWAGTALENAMVRNDQRERIIPQDRGVAGGRAVPSRATT